MTSPSPPRLPIGSIYISALRSCSLHWSLFVFCNPALAFHERTTVACEQAKAEAAKAGVGAQLCMPIPIMLHFDSLGSHDTSAMSSLIWRYVVSAAPNRSWLYPWALVWRVETLIIPSSTGYTGFGPMAQCVVHALKCLACRARVTPVSLPASSFKQCLSA